MGQQNQSGRTLAGTGRVDGLGRFSYRLADQPEVRERGGCLRCQCRSLHPLRAVEPAPRRVNVVFCDGSVHFLSQTIESKLGGNCGDSTADPVHKYFPTANFTYQKLYNPKDGLAVTVP
jgi:prepilin-type processing-associated H-X9-DG protein